jgi:2-aminoadipate transaminase
MVMWGYNRSMLPVALDITSEEPLYKQVFERIREQIESGTLISGERLPATRELAVQLGVNRATISAAYELLASEGFISGRVGRGSFVLERPKSGGRWHFEPGPQTLPMSAAISFATSCPPQDLFPLEEFRASCDEVMRSPEFPTILQLGSPAGYEPLRSYLLGEARRRGLARPADDLLITSGCQQAFDLLCRVLVRPGDPVAVEDPLYPGLKNLFIQSGARLIPIPVGKNGIDPVLLRDHARLIVVTPNFQNPTGATMPLAARETLLAKAIKSGAVVVENDLYGELRYAGDALPSLKQLDTGEAVVRTGSFSKVAFPGLRVGWIIGAKPLIARLTQAKNLCDLHTDQLSQAVLLRFAESGRLERHVADLIGAGRQRLEAVLAACSHCLPAGSDFTRPQGGMNVWVRLPEPLDASDLLPRAHRENVAYLPGKYFSVSQPDPGALRLSFASLSPDQIRQGLDILGNLFCAELARSERPITAMV